MTIQHWFLDRDIMTLVGPDDIDRPMAYWFCMYGNCHRVQQACARCYEVTHSDTGRTCAKTYPFKHRRAAIRCRWHWYLIEGIDLHMCTTLDLHQTALRRLERKRRHEENED